MTTLTFSPAYVARRIEQTLNAGRISTETAKLLCSKAEKHPGVVIDFIRKQKRVVL